MSESSQSTPVRRTTAAPAKPIAWPLQAIELLVSHRYGPPRMFMVDEALLRCRVIEVLCIECEGTGSYTLPDGDAIPCNCCKTAGTCPVWI